MESYTLSHTIGIISKAMEIVAVMKLEITGLSISNNVENPHEQLFSKPRKKLVWKKLDF